LRKQRKTLGGYFFCRTLYIGLLYEPTSKITQSNFSRSKNFKILEISNRLTMVAKDSNW